MRTSAISFIDDLQASGRFVFTTDQAVVALGGSVAAVRAAIRRLKEKRLVAAPYRGFHVVVPPAYRRLGCLPADQFVPQLMAHIGEPYYVGLLSAASYHGAAHQAPQVFQVMLRKARRRLTCGDVRVDFVGRRDMDDTPIVERNTPTGTLRIASPAATAIELVGYVERCGYLDNVATVLAELAESIDGGALAGEARRAPVAWVQRLGYLLTLVDAGGLAAHLDGVLAERNTFTVPIAPWLETAGSPRDPRWQVLINTDVVPDV
jgi:predicted transcriptional regulator of viral defense system